MRYAIKAICYIATVIGVLVHAAGLAMLGVAISMFFVPRLAMGPDDTISWYRREAERFIGVRFSDNGRLLFKQEVRWHIPGENSSYAVRERFGIGSVFRIMDVQSSGPDGIRHDGKPLVRGTEIYVTPLFLAGLGAVTALFGCVPAVARGYGRLFSILARCLERIVWPRRPRGFDVVTNLPDERL